MIDMRKFIIAISILLCFVSQAWAFPPGFIAGVTASAPAGGPTTYIMARVPTATIGGTFVASPGPLIHTMIDDATDGTHDSDTTYMYKADAATAETFTSAVFDVPAGATINRVSVVGYSKSAGVGSVSVRAQIGLGAAPTFYYGTQTAHDYTDYTVHTQTWATNPATSSAWTVDEVNGASGSYINQWGIAARDLVAGETLYVTVGWIEVEYEI